MITRREFITTGVSASVGLQLHLSSISKKDKQILQRAFKPRCIPGEIYRIIWGDYPGFDFPDWQEYLIFCHGFQLACYSPIFTSKAKKRLKPGELLYHFHSVSHLGDWDYDFIPLTESDLNQLYRFDLFTS